MKPRFRLPGGRTTKVLVGCLLVLAATVALFEWNWFRGPLERYLSGKSAREVRIGHLDVNFGFSLEPTVTLRGVHVENAPWAAQRPFASVGEASFTVSVKSILQRRPVISRLVLIDGDVDMERLADGRRNWRLRHTDDPSPGRVRVLTLEAHRSQIRFRNEASDLDFVAVASALGKETDDGLSTRISFKGTYAGTRFSGEALNGGVVSFRDSGVTFPLRGHISWARARLTLDGFFTDVFDLGPMDAAVRVEGVTLAQLHPFVRVRPPPSRPFRFEAHLTHAHDVYRFSHLRGTIGDSDIAGHATYDRSRDRPRVEAELRSETAHLPDLSPLVGMRYPGSPSAGPEPGRARASKEPDEPGDDRNKSRAASRIFPAHTLRVERLRTVDARVTLNVRQLKAPGLSMLESLRVVAELDDGKLELKPVEVGIAGGRIAGSIVFDARQQPPSSRAALDLHGIRLATLMPSLSETARTAGAIRGQIRLAGEGRSIAAMFGNATGSLVARIDPGRISNRVDAKLGLNGGKILSLLVRGDRDIALNCGALVVDIRKGTGTSRTIVLDTEETHTVGAGTLDLRDERWDLLLTPEPRNPGLLTRRASIRVQGSFRTAASVIQERVALGRRGGEATAQGSAGGDACSAVTPRDEAPASSAPGTKPR